MTTKLTRGLENRNNSALFACVIGSGPTGVACAHALLARGARVLMLDAGITLEPERLGLVERLRRSQPEAWSPEDVAAYQAGMNPHVGGVPLKLVYGSDFAYREADAQLNTDYNNVGLRPSLARGGLSNVWGAAMLPFLEPDLADWPFPLATLKEHYARVLEFTGLAASRDDLETLFPLHTRSATELRLSRQCQQMLATLERHRARLAAEGFHFGRSRLAVRGNRAGSDDGCVYCRLCMYGCPYGFIYSSADTLPQLQAQPNFEYRGGVVVTAVREGSSVVEIHGHELRSRKPREWTCDRVFVAAGTLATTAILLRSLDAYNQTVWLKDSQYFLLPLAQTRRVSGATRESLHALSQLFLELRPPGGPEHTAHVQIYSNNDLINHAVANVFGPLRRPFGLVVRNLQDRLLIAQGFLHSATSSRIAVRLCRGVDNAPVRLELRGEVNPAAPAAVRRVARKLFALWRPLGAVPLLPMLKIAEPGRSFHSGGSFPMRKNPRGFETDLLGRPPGCKRIHAVDATVFPSIPATTITFSAMANAHRIGWQAAQLAPED